MPFLKPGLPRGELIPSPPPPASPPVTPFRSATRGTGAGTLPPLSPLTNPLEPPNLPLLLFGVVGGLLVFTILPLPLPPTLLLPEALPLLETLPEPEGVAIFVHRGELEFPTLNARCTPSECLEGRGGGCAEELAGDTRPFEADRTVGRDDRFTGA